MQKSGSLSKEDNGPQFSNKVKQIISSALFFMVVFSAAGQVNLLRYNDNFDYLKKDSVSKKGTEKLKFMKLAGSSVISIGGELREQLQYYRNINFGDVPASFRRSTTWQLWQRVMVHANMEINKSTRLFAQLGSTHRFINPNPLTPEIDQNDLGLQQAFIEYKHKNNWLLRAGRQELSYGSHRLITFREGPNTRLAFDGVILKYNTGKIKIDLLGISPVISKKGLFDDQAFKDRLAGIYLSEAIIPTWLHLDYYFISFHSKRRQYQFTGGNENREVTGLRLFSERSILNYELEATYQFGKFNKLHISAYGISFDVNYKFMLPENVLIGLACNYVTGDRNNSDKQLNTYNLLFAKPQYGLAAPIGATNIVTVNPYLKFNPVRKINVYAGVNFMWRQSNQDGIYSPGAIEMHPATGEVVGSAKKQIGTLWVMESNYLLTKYVSFSIDASYLAAGSYIRQTGKGKDIMYVSFKAGYRF